MTTPEGIAFGSLILGFLGLIYKFTNDEDKKRSRIYTRIDEVKTDVDNKYQKKELCDLHVTQLTSDLKEIKMDVKKLLVKNNVE